MFACLQLKFKDSGLVFFVDGSFLGYAVQILRPKLSTKREARQDSRVLGLGIETWLDDSDVQAY